MSVLAYTGHKYSCLWTNSTKHWDAKGTEGRYNEKEYSNHLSS